VSVDIRIRAEEDLENKNIKIGIFIDREKETEIELSVARKLYNDILQLLDKTLPASDENEEEGQKEESKIIVP